MILFISVCAANTNYQGPYIFWGLPFDEYSESGSLKAVNIDNLQKYFKDADRVFIFVKNKSDRIQEEGFSETKNIITSNRFIYLPQDSLTVDPHSVNENIEVSFCSSDFD